MEVGNNLNAQIPGNIAIKLEKNINAEENPSTASTTEPSPNDDIEDQRFFDDLLPQENIEGRLTKSEPLEVKGECGELEDGELTDENETTREAKNNSHSYEPRLRIRSNLFLSDDALPKKPVPSTSVCKIEPTNNDDAIQATSPPLESEMNLNVAQKQSTDHPRIRIRSEFSSPNLKRPQSPKEPMAISDDQPSGSRAALLALETRTRELKQLEKVKSKPDVKLTFDEKVDNALERLVQAKKALYQARQQKEQNIYPDDLVFSYTSTIRKLPSNPTRFTQQIYDHRSPLHAINNVTFSFNSTANRLNLKEWGLEALPPHAREKARVLGIDADTIHTKMLELKIPESMQKDSRDVSNETEECEQTESSLFMNAKVQTDEVRILPPRRRGFYRDFGVQFQPDCHVIGTQTSSKYTDSNDLPLFGLIRQLNVNQLQAVDDFVQMIIEPRPESDIEMYQQRSRLFEIYKASQMSCEWDNSLKRSASTAGFPNTMPNPPPPPRLRPFEPEFPIDPRHYQQGNQLGRFSNHNPGNPSPRYFGRGGLRR